MSLSEPVAEVVVLYHPVVVKYAEHYNLSPDVVFKRFQKVLEDPHKTMSITWGVLGSLVDSDVILACSKTFCYGWDYDDETKELRSLFVEFVAPRNKSLEDWL